jgi:hypothetical protein
MERIIRYDRVSNEVGLYTDKRDRNILLIIKRGRQTEFVLFC